MATLPMIFYGFQGLFVFRWGGFNFIPQIAHIIMTLNVGSVWWETMFFLLDFEVAFKGMVVGMFIWFPFIYQQQKYFYAHPKEADEFLFNPRWNEPPKK